MPTDTSTAAANATSRRSFLTRLVPKLQQSGGTFDDGTLAEFLTPLELGAVQICQLALDGGKLDTIWTPLVQKLQAHHQTVSDTLTAMIPTTAAAPLASDDLVKQLGAAVSSATDLPTTLVALAAVEDLLSATHLLSIATIPDPVTAKVIAQVLAAEAQNAAALGHAGNQTIEQLTPKVATDAGGLAPGDLADAPPPTTTTTAAGN